MSAFKRFILSVLFLFMALMQGQTFTHSGYLYGGNGVGISGIPVSLYKRTATTTFTSNLTVRIFSTHAGNGSTTQYSQYPSTLEEMDRCFNTAYSNTVLKWTGTLPATTALNWNSSNQLSALGAAVPNGGEFFSTEVTGTFVPKETGTYYFGVNSDDGGDILIDNTLVTSYYGGHGMSGPVYGGIYLNAGQSYAFKARMQEYGGGEGLAVVWRRPSQPYYTLQTDELGGTSSTSYSSWAVVSTSTTNTSGYYAFNVATGTGDEFYFTFSAPGLPALTNTDAQEANKYVLDKSLIKSKDYYRFDTNNDSRFTVSDVYSIFAKKNGILGAFQATPSTKILTASQWSIVNSSTSDLRSTYPGVQNITISNPTSGGTSNFYLLKVGYTN